MIDESSVKEVKDLIEALNGVDKVAIIVAPDGKISEILVMPYPDTKRSYKHIQKDIRVVLVNKGFPRIDRESISIAAFERL
ncbi:MAG: hypothetical protein ACUVXI_17650 [bacterium]